MFSLACSIINAEILPKNQVKPSWNFKDGVKKNVIVEPLGAMVKLRCPAKGLPQPDIKWLKNNIPIENISRPGYSQDNYIIRKPFMLKPEKWELKIHGLQKSDHGKYTCIVSNTEGILKHTYHLDVLDYIRDVPILVVKSANLTLLPGMTANFQCKFETDLGLLIHWLRPIESIRNESNNKKLLDGSNLTHFEMIEDNGKSVIGENYTIVNVTSEDSGLYFCVGQTNAGMTPGVLHLTVLDEDEAIITQPKNVTVEIGKTAYMSCSSHSDLIQNPTWKSKMSQLNLKDYMPVLLVILRVLFTLKLI